LRNGAAQMFELAKIGDLNAYRWPKSEQPGIFKFPIFPIDDDYNDYG
jgi:hypothetical protein